jgi:hypothetical protein
MLFGNTVRGITGMALCTVALAVGGCGEDGREDTTTLQSTIEEAPAETVVAVVAAPEETVVEAPAEVSAPEPTAAAAPLVCAKNPEGTSALDCDGDAANGCEVDPFSDDRNCGSCGHACGGEFPSCVQKRCCNAETRDCE